MKKIYRWLLCAVAVIGLNTSCEDVPAPYNILGDGTFLGKSLPYKSSNMNTGWETACLSENEPWSKGSSWVQATGYQDWEGSGTKSNREVSSCLISPAFSTKAESGKVRFSFDYTLKYTNNVADWKKNHRIYISQGVETRAEGNEEFDLSEWTEIAWNPVASPYSDWTTYTSGGIQIPDEFVNKENVRIAFYFYAPKEASTTWELLNFLIEEGEGMSAAKPSAGQEITCAKAAELCVALAAGTESAETYVVTGYITDVFANVSKGQQTFWMADTKDGGKVLQAYWANLPEGVEKFTKGTKVKITGKLFHYVKDGTSTAEIKNADVVILEDASEEEPEPSEGDPNIAIEEETVMLTNPNIYIPEDFVEEELFFSDCGFTNGQDLTTEEINSDYFTISFGKGTAEKNVPKYYNASQSPRIYPGNTMTITGREAPIAMAILKCDVYQGENCVGQSTATLTFSGNSMTYTNAGDGTGTAVQLRPKSIKIILGAEEAK